MSEDVPFDSDAICDICQKKGAYDFMGDLLCPGCAEKAIGAPGRTKRRIKSTPK